jgi:hypothetical protein
MFRSESTKIEKWNGEKISQLFPISIDEIRVVDEDLAQPTKKC